MSILNKLSILLEAFYQGAKIGSRYIEFFINPSSYEVDEIAKNADYNSVRISGDIKGNLYVWDGNVLHVAMASKVKFDMDVALVADLIGKKEGKNHYDIYHDKSKYVGNNMSNKAKALFLKRLKDAFPSYQYGISSANILELDVWAH